MEPVNATFIAPPAYSPAQNQDSQSSISQQMLQLMMQMMQMMQQQQPAQQAAPADGDCTAQPSDGGSTQPPSGNGGGGMVQDLMSSLASMMQAFGSTQNAQGGNAGGGEPGGQPVMSGGL